MVMLWQIQRICPNPPGDAANCETWLTNLAQTNYDFVWEFVEPRLINAGFITVGAAVAVVPANAWCDYPDVDGFVTFQINNMNHANKALHNLLKNDNIFGLVADALEKLEAGASLVQLYTGFIYEGPGLIKAINKAILAQSN